LTSHDAHLYVGNWDANNASYTWLIDTLPPLRCSVVSEVKASYASTYNVSQIVFTLSGEDEVVASASYAMVNSVAAWSTTEATDNRAVVSVANVQDGLHTIHFKAQDEAGNISPQPCAIFSWFVDTTPPVVGVTAPPAASRIRQDWVKLKLSSDEPLKAVLYRQLDSVLWIQAPVFQGMLLVNTSGTGAQQVFLKGVDKAGNTQPVAVQFSWFVDLTAPSIWLEHTPEILRNATAFHIPIRWSEELSDLWISVDMGPFFSVLFPAGSLNLVLPVNSSFVNGPHVLSLKGEFGIATFWCQLYLLNDVWYVP
jgi:hypothetical protein